jgi:hypothetical protein
VFEFRRAPAVQGGFIEEALGTAQGRWRSYVVDPSGARRAVRDEDVEDFFNDGDERDDFDARRNFDHLDDPRLDGVFGGGGEWDSDREEKEGGRPTRSRNMSSPGRGQGKERKDRERWRTERATTFSDAVAGRGGAPAVPVRGPRGIVVPRGSVVPGDGTG